MYNNENDEFDIYPETLRYSKWERLLMLSGVIILLAVIGAVVYFG
jgi:hypothetical protein